MLVIVGKAIPNEERGYVELFLDNFRNIMRSKGSFVYAWSFNPDERAISCIRHYLDNDEVFIYLPEKGCCSRLRMHVINFRHNPQGMACPGEWQSYCINELLDHKKFGADRKIWFLIDNIEEFYPPVDLFKTYTPVFLDKYRKWGQNHFAFLRDKGNR